MVRLHLSLPNKTIHGRNFYPSVPTTFQQTAFLQEGKPGPLLQGGHLRQPLWFHDLGILA